MLGNLTGWHALILLAVIILLFGATRLPALARSVGQSARIFRSEVRPAGADATSDGGGSASVVAPATPASPALATAAPTSSVDVPHGER